MELENASDVSMPIRLICSTGGSIASEIRNDLNLAHSMPSGAVHSITLGRRWPS